MRQMLVFIGAVAAVAACVLVVLGVPGAGGAAGSVQARWVMTDLGTLGGKESSAVAINERGQIVGSSETKGDNAISHGFLWEKGKMRDLGSLTGSSWANDINDRGQVVGTSVSRTKNREGSRIEHAVLWQSGKMLDLTPTAKLAPLDCYGDGSRGSCDASADVINGRGQVVVSMTSNVSGNLHVDRAFLWQSGKLVALPTLGAPSWSWGSTWVGGINDRGQIVGAAETGETPGGGSVSLVHAFLWQNGKLTDLGTLAGNSRATRVDQRARRDRRGERTRFGRGSARTCRVAEGECPLRRGRRCVLRRPINDVGQSGRSARHSRLRPDQEHVVCVGERKSDQAFRPRRGRRLRERDQQP